MIATDYEEQLDLFNEELVRETNRAGVISVQSFRCHKMTNDEARNILVGFLRENFDLLQDLATLPARRVEIMRWVMDKSRTDVFGFDKCAIALGIEPRYLRDEFLKHGLKDLITI